LLLTFGEERDYAGNFGYSDDPSKVYEYDSSVPNHLQVTKGDLAILRDKDKLLGVARIERIDTHQGTKERRRCPVYNTTKMKRRRNKQPEFRCYNGGHEFAIPTLEVTTCTLFTAHFGNSFVPAQEAVSLSVLRDACLKLNKQLAMQLLDIKRIEAPLIARAPAVRQLLAMNSDSGYIKANDAEIVGITQNSSETAYSPIQVDNREVVMRQIRERRGQQRFRQALRALYGDQCMITSCQLLDIIEAAHISPYRGEVDNHPENGLLLRTDLHTLFDLDLLGINPESLQVQLHPKALAAGYHEWQGKPLLCSKAKPSQTALESKWRLFLTRLQDEYILPVN
jgi:hypothetical protein